jgi:hypothetical protein
MRKVFSLTALFVLTTIVAVHFRSRLKDENDFFEAKEIESERENESDGPEKFLRFHQGIRTRSDEEKPGYPTNYQWAELQRARHFSAKRSVLAARTQSGGNGVISYTERGPGNVPGRTRGLIVDPDDATHNTWFAGSASGGIWKTTNGGTSWQWLTPSIPNLATTTLAMAESNHNTIYAGIGEGFGLVDGVNGNGIFKSIDRGVSWNLLTNSAPLGSVNRLAVDPSNENNILAAANSGIYHSIDGGTNWTKVYSGVVQDLRPTPGNFLILFAAENRVGVLKSIDGGVTWNKSNTGMSPSGRVEIAVSPKKTNRIIASAQGTLSGAKSDLYLSDDGGLSWYLVSLSLANKTVDYLATSSSDQGWYDNTVAFSPYNQDVVYIGGIGSYQITLGSVNSSSSGSYAMQEINTSSFLTLVNFGASASGGKLETGSGVNSDTVQIRFGPGLTQKAHRFLVPVGSTSGVPAASYSYQDYVDVPFQVWDLKTKQQLMVSFRDQDRNFKFNLLPLNTSATDATQQSREYIFVNNVPYNPGAPNPSIATAGGQEFQEMYFFWPVGSSTTWDPNTLPLSNLQIVYQQINKYSSTVSSVADVYSEYDKKNNYNFVHPDQHNIYPIKINEGAQTYQLLMANDGGIYISSVSTSPGTTQGEWAKVSNGYNTSQFYGADKKPGAQEYFGGMQDNASYFTPSGTVASATTSYSTNVQLSGDGFEAIWHSQDGKKMIGSTYYNQFSRSLDGGSTWTAAIKGLSTDLTTFPFISKLASSKQAPDILYTVGEDVVWKSTDFGGNWTPTSIASGLGLTDFATVELSRANANILWVGSNMSVGKNLSVSTDAGKTFTAVSNPVGYTLGNLTGLATHPTNEKVAYALFSFAKTAKILMTNDLGQTWSDISGFGTGTSSSTGFPDVAVYSLYVRSDNTSIIWAGTEIGIIESLDGGASWALLTEFPSVAVWQMKGQDDEIVIATHGRGIWTAKVPVDQNINFPVPNIITSGTSPQSKFIVQAHLPIHYDSLHLVINSQSVKVNPPDSGTYNIQVSNVQKGNVTIQLIGYKGNAPIYSLATNGVNLSLLAVQKQFYDYFVSNSNFYLSGLSLQSFGTSNSSLQSGHPYSASQETSGTLLVPIIISNTGNTSISYQDVAIIQPGVTGSVFGQSAFNDYVIVEATKDGLTWKKIANGYNASANTDWLTAFNANSQGSPLQTVTETFDLKNTFNAGDTMLFRFRLHANSDTKTGWGWSIDNLYIQQQPTEVEPTINATEFSAYPNPTTGKLNLNFTLPTESHVTVNVWDMTGRSVMTQDFENQSEGGHRLELNLESMSDGMYLVRLKTLDGQKSIRVLVRK